MYHLYAAHLPRRDELMRRFVEEGIGILIQKPEWNALSTRLTRGRRWLFGSLAALLVYGVVELGSFAMFWWVDGELFSFCRIRAEQAALAESEEPVRTVRGAEELLRAAQAADPGAAETAHVKLKDATTLRMTPRRPGAEKSTVLRVPVEAGNLRLTSRVELMRAAQFPVVLKISVQAGVGANDVLLNRTLTAGDIVFVDRSVDLEASGVLKIACAMAESAENLAGAHLIFHELQTDATQAGSSAASRPPKRRGGGFRIDRILHPYLGYVIEPGSVAHRRGMSFQATEYGFYDDGPPLHRRSPDKVIIAFLGGSVAEKFSQTGVAALERELRRSPRFADKEFVFVRAALRGYKQPQQLMALTYLLALGGQLDLVINIDGFNEVAFHAVENGKQGVAAVFPRNWYMHFTDRADQEVRRRMGEISYLEGRRQHWSRRYAAGPLGLSITASLLWRIRDRQLGLEIAERSLALQQYQPEGGVPYEVTGFRKGYSDGEAVAEDLATIWKRSSLQLDRLCRGNGIRYFHFLQPNQYVPGSKPLSAAERQHAYNERHPYKRGFDLGYPFLVAGGRQLAAAGVRFHDLSMVFAGVEEDLYVDPCCHFNERGNEIMAAEIARVILADGR